MDKKQQRIKGWRRCRCSYSLDHWIPSYSRDHWIPSSWRGYATHTTPTLWLEYNTTSHRPRWTLQLTADHDQVPLKSPHEATAKMAELLLLCQT